jgi:hypothetical protein
MTRIITKLKELFTCIVLCVFISGCLTAKKMDQFVAEQYNNKLPAPVKKKDPAIIVTSAISFTPEKKYFCNCQKNKSGNTPDHLLAL